MPDAACRKSTPSKAAPTISTWIAAETVTADASMEPPKATTRQVLARRVITSVAATVARRITTAAETLTLTNRNTLNSTSPPHQKHQPHDQCDHVGQVRVKTARL